jgi:hypothetical protein
MSLKKRIAFVFVWLGLMFSLASAQSGKNELGLLLGGAVTPSLAIAGQSSDVRFGGGLTFQATYARRLASATVAALYFEVPFLAAPLINVSSSDPSVPANYASIFITPGVRLKLVPDSAISPWLSVGGGYARFHESAERQDGAPNTGRIGANRGAAEFSGGLDIHTPLKILLPINLRVEVRDIYSGQPNYNVNTGGGFQHNVLFSGGFVVSF